jgi:hypothetical protein
MFGHSTSVQLHNHTSFPNRPDQPRFSLVMQASLSSAQEQPLLLSSFLPSPGSSLFRLTDHLPRPNCHSHGFTSYTLLPSQPSAAAVSQLPTGKPNLLCSGCCTVEEWLGSSSESSRNRTQMKNVALHSRLPHRFGSAFQLTFSEHLN